jgi:hypothetical protein
MPFVSLAQARACYARRADLAKQGKKSRWDCDKWAKETDWAKLKREAKSKSKAKAKSKSTSRTPKVHVGPRGGRYIMVKGRKVYV